MDRTVLITWTKRESFLCSFLHPSFSPPLPRGCLVLPDSRGQRVGSESSRPLISVPPEREGRPQKNDPKDRDVAGACSPPPPLLFASGRGLRVALLPSPPLPRSVLLPGFFGNSGEELLPLLPPLSRGEGVARESRFLCGIRSALKLS